MAVVNKRPAEPESQGQPQSKKLKASTPTTTPAKPHTPTSFNSLPRELRQMIFYNTYGDEFVYKHDSLHDFLTYGLVNDGCFYYRESQISRMIQVWMD